MTEKFNPEKYPYQVVRPIVNFGQPEYYSSADPVSQHLTPKAAWEKIDSVIAQLKRQLGMQGSYLQWTVIDARTFEPCSRADFESRDLDEDRDSEDAYQRYVQRGEQDVVDEVY
jgi:hypothetical protein